MTRRIVRHLLAGLTVAAGAALGASPALEAQQPIDSAGMTAAAGGGPVTWAAVPDSLRAVLERLRERGDLGAIARVDRVVYGPVRIAIGDTIHGPLVVHGGSLELDGVVRGSVAVVGGDLIIGDAARIEGSASAVGGTVRVAGGDVTGDIRSISAEEGGVLGRVDALDPRSIEVVDSDPAADTWRAVKLVVASFAIFLILGIGLLVFSQPTFDGVVRALETGFTRAFWTGMLAQFAILPVLLLLVLALAISLVGILLIPFAVVAYVVAVVGLLALGFLAAARLTGGIFGRNADPAARGATLRNLVVGLVVYFGLWLLAAGTSWHPLAGTALRSVAVAVTWVAMTVGLGAIISAGLAARRTRAGAHLPRVAANPMEWQTPTPITGVVAARRTLSPSREA